MIVRAKSPHRSQHRGPRLISLSDMRAAGATVLDIKFSLLRLAEERFTVREQIEVFYENGVLRPLEALPSHFQEHQHLTVPVEDADETAGCLADADPAVSLEAVRRALARTPGTIAQLVRSERDER